MSDAYTPLTTLTITKQGATATLQLVRKKDGSVEFTDANGNKVIAHGNDEMSRLFKTLDSLT
jgi:hypothetical protein